MNFKQTQEKLRKKIKAVHSNINELVKFVCREVWPFKGQQHFVDLMSMFEAIATKKHCGQFLHQIDVLLALSFLLSIVQCFYHQPTFMLLTFDYYGRNQLTSSVKMSKALLNITTYYFFKHMFFSIGKFKHFPVLKQVLINDDRRFVFGSKFCFWKYILWSQGFYQAFLLLIELWLIASYIQFCGFLPKLALSPLYLWPLAYLCMSVSFLLFSVTFLLIYVSSNAASVIFYEISLLFERLKFQSSQNLRQRLNRLTAVYLLKYCKENTESLMFAFEISKTFGTLLLIFLWTNVPSNVSFITVLIFPNTCALSVRLVCLLLVFYQITGLIFIHSVAAMVTSRIHKPYKKMYSQFVRYKTCSLLAHLKISNNVQAFLVKKGYGITYQMLGRTYGLVSMFAFLKFILLYAEMILYSYSMYLHSYSNRIHKL